MPSVLFVCLGNICRSPLAEGVFRHKVREAGLVGRFRIDSAGTGAWHCGNPPDPRSIEVAAIHGIDISGQRARQVTSSDYDRFDYLVAMDADNLANLRSGKGREHPGIRLLLADPPANVPDPYYGGPRVLKRSISWLPQVATPYCRPSCKNPDRWIAGVS